MPVGYTATAAPRQAQALRWAYANADGVLVNKPGRLYYVRLVGIVSGNVEITAVLRDGTSAAANPILAVTVAAGTPDDWPRVPVSLGFRTALYVTFNGGTASNRLLSAGWETD